MEKQEVLDRMLSERLIPVVRVATSEEAMGVAEALTEGGASLIEITLTVQGALDAIREILRKYGGKVIVGAGTVLNVEEGHEALLAGARFLVSPVLNLELIQFARRSNVVVIPGAMSPTEIVAAWDARADMVKVFPVGHLGGPDYIKALKGPFPQIPLVPTGGVTLQNAASYIRAGAAVLGVGGELVDRKAVADKTFHMITEKTRAYLRAVREV